MSDWQSPDDDMQRDVKLAGGVVVLQTVLLYWVAAAPSTIFLGTRAVVLLLSLVAAFVVVRAVRRREPGADDSWWRPDWRYWLLGMIFPVSNLGVWGAFALRVREVTDSDRPTDQWKYPTVLGAVVSAVGTATIQSTTGGEVGGALISLIAIVSLVAVGFTLVAAYYDTRYVGTVIGNAGSGWLFNGFHWVVLLGAFIPSNFILSFLYLLRRRMLLNRAERGDRSIEQLAAGDPGPDDAEAVEGDRLEGADAVEGNRLEDSNAADDGDFQRGPE